MQLVIFDVAYCFLLQYGMKYNHNYYCIQKQMHPHHNLPNYYFGEPSHFHETYIIEQKHVWYYDVSIST